MGARRFKVREGTQVCYGAEHRAGGESFEVDENAPGMAEQIAQWLANGWAVEIGPAPAAAPKSKAKASAG